MSGNSPDRLGVYVGYRLWGLYRGYESYMQPMFPPGLYPSGYGIGRWKLDEVNEALCRGTNPATHLKKARGGYRRWAQSNLGEQKHEAPDFECCCGFHGYYDMNWAWREVVTSTLSLFHVFGVAYFWGEIVHHETFFRSRYALPAALVVPRDRERQVGSRSLENMYKAHVYQASEGVLPVFTDPEEAFDYAVRRAEQEFGGAIVGNTHKQQKEVQS